MKRNIQWGALAILPLIGAIYFSLMVQNTENYVPFFAVGNKFLTDYWWSILSGISAIPWFIFFFHAIKNKAIIDKYKILWVIAMVVGFVYVAPVYWWIYSEKTNA